MKTISVTACPHQSNGEACRTCFARDFGIALDVLAECMEKAPPRFKSCPDFRHFQTWFTRANQGYQESLLAGLYDGDPEKDCELFRRLQKH